MRNVEKEANELENIWLISSVVSVSHGRRLLRWLAAAPSAVLPLSDPRQDTHIHAKSNRRNNHFHMQMKETRKIK
ncbi:hypothetical protein Mapa_005503 [Marchantia paleacea]|nr:hypothetical protein Mapa_005503 [Marchantia paleacea]